MCQRFAPGLMLGSRGPAALGPDRTRGDHRGGTEAIDGSVGALLRAGARAPSPPVRFAAVDVRADLERAEERHNGAEVRSVEVGAPEPSSGRTDDARRSAS